MRINEHFKTAHRRIPSVKRDHGQFNANQQEHLQKIVSDPVLFATHVLGVTLWTRQIEILRSIQARRRTAIKACHAAGKTFTLAIAPLWWLTRYSDGIVLTTSSTQRQVCVTNTSVSS